MSTTDNNTGAEKSNSTTKFDEEQMDDDSEHEERVSDIVDTVTADTFDKWYKEREYAQNILDGQPYFNSPGYIAPEQKHSPSKLLQCQRKVYYKNQNTPAEDDMPTGILWIGSRFEEEIALPFLQDTANEIHDNNYVRQDMWVDFDVNVDGTDLRIKGETDPVITDSEGAPLVVTEIKTTGYIDSKKGPNAEPSERHKAQLHAYMAGLSKSYDRDIHKGLIIYGERDSFEMAVHEVNFDEDFWEDRCLDWAQEQTEYRLDEDLPPAEPEQPSWECKYCDFKNRCGENDDNDWEDTGVDGFVPLVEYPQSSVVDYIKSESANGAKLTPMLAHQHPNLVDKFDVFDWECDHCESTYDWDRFDWDGDNMNPPSCPNCKEEHGNLPLRGPLPEDQLDD